MFKRLMSFIGILILLFVINTIGIQKVLASVLAANVLYLAVAFLLMFGVVFFQSLRWKYVLKAQSIEIDTIDIMKIWLIGWYYGVITPGKIGSFIRIKYLMDKTGKSLGKCTSNIMLDRLLDMLALLSLASVGALIVSKEFSDAYLIILIFLFLILSLWILIDKEKTRILAKIFFNIAIPNNLKSKSIEIFNSFYENIPEKKTLFPLFIFSLFNWVFLQTVIYIVALAFSVEVPYYLFITVVPIASVVGLIPITISGLGTREAALITLFLVYGVAPEKTMAFSLTGFVISNILMAIPGAVLSMKKS
jgi:uncharacterized protein (TIRG00374 family)